MTHNIILIDDNSGEAVLHNHLIRKHKLDIRIHHFFNYSDFDKNLEAFGAKISCILLDYDMPELNGIDVLKLIKNNNKLINVPVIMLSNVIAPNIVCNSYKLGAVAYILKPKDNQEMLAFLHSIEAFWGKFNYY